MSIKHALNCITNVIDVIRMVVDMNIFEFHGIDGMHESRVHDFHNFNGWKASSAWNGRFLMHMNARKTPSREDQLNLARSFHFQYHFP
ncbi:hypothetical protein GF325_01575 [Candidatus Bathyarchaeota archaeon]|nr:hypothetical protein [Candidatus Bathyarchaeota archaeon]